MMPAMRWADSSALILSRRSGHSGARREVHEVDGPKRQTVLVENFGFAADRVIVLADKKTSKADIRKALSPS